MHQSFENPNSPPRGIQGAFTLYVCGIFYFDISIEKRSILFSINIRNSHENEKTALNFTCMQSEYPWYALRLGVLVV